MADEWHDDGAEGAVVQAVNISIHPHHHHLHQQALETASNTYGR